MSPKYTEEEIRKARSILGHLNSIKGRKAYLAKSSPEQRSERGRRNINVRWDRERARRAAAEAAAQNATAEES
jgi:hypothetical protein